MIRKILFLAVLLVLGITMDQTSFAQSQRDCNQHKICAQPGDYLKYSAQAHGSNGTISYNFGSPIDSNTLKVSISTAIGNVTTSNQSILNLKNTTLINSDGSKGSFFFMVLTPINPNEVSASPFKESTGTFNGYQRTILALDASSGTNSEKVEVDKETGILLGYTVSRVVEISGQQVVTSTSFTLADTNIITSSDIQVATGVPSSIPPAINYTTGGPNAVPADNTIIIYMGIGIAAAGAGAGIVIMKKRKSKNVS